MTKVRYSLWLEIDARSPQGIVDAWESLCNLPGYVNHSIEEVKGFPIEYDGPNTGARVNDESVIAEREALNAAIAEVLFHVRNFAEPAQTHLGCS